MSRWTKWVVAQTDEAMVRAWMDRWVAPRPWIHPIHVRLTRRWQPAGRDLVTGLYWARRNADRPTVPYITLR
jgi:hypothetical protein